MGDVKITITGWKPGLNKVLLTRFLSREIKLLGQGHVVSDLLKEGKPISFRIDESELERTAQLLTDWNAVFEIVLSEGSCQGNRVDRVNAVE